MSEDGLDLDTIIALESRITAALDRIAGAAAVNAVAAQSGDGGPGLDEAVARADALGAELAQAQDALGAALAERDALRRADDTEEDRVGLREKADRLRSERNDIRDERDALAEELDMFRSKTGSETLGEMLTALRDVRKANADLRAQCEELRQAAVAGEGAPEPETLNAAMAAELLSLRAERAADAAEMRLILDELRPMVEDENAESGDA